MKGPQPTNGTVIYDDNLSRKLLISVSNGDCEEFDALVKQGANRHFNLITPPHGYNILQFATADGQIGMFQHLVEKHGFNKNIRTATGETVLHIAARHNRIPMCKYLVENQGIDIKSLDCQGNNIFDSAIQANRRDEVSLSYLNGKMGLLVNNLNHAESNRARHSSDESVATTCERDSLSSIRDSEDSTINSKDIHILHDIPTRLPDIPIPPQQILPRKAITPTDHESLSYSQIRIAHELELMDVLAKGHMQKYSQFLEQKQTSQNEIMPTMDGYNALLFVAAYGTPLMFDHLVRQHGFDKNIKTADGYDAAMVAAIHGQKDMYKHLIQQHDFDKDAVDFSGNNALLLTIKRNNPGSARFLIDKMRFNPKIKDTVGLDIPYLSLMKEMDLNPRIERQGKDLLDLSLLFIHPGTVNFVNYFHKLLSRTPEAEQNLELHLVTSPSKQNEDILLMRN